MCGTNYLLSLQINGNSVRISGQESRFRDRGWLKENATLDGARNRRNRVDSWEEWKSRGRERGITGDSLVSRLISRVLLVVVGPFLSIGLDIYVSVCSPAPPIEQYSNCTLPSP